LENLLPVGFLVSGVDLS